MYVGYGPRGRRPRAAAAVAVLLIAYPLANLSVIEPRAGWTPLAPRPALHSALLVVGLVAALALARRAYSVVYLGLAAGFLIALFTHDVSNEADVFFYAVAGLVTAKLMNINGHLFDEGPPPASIPNERPDHMTEQDMLPKVPPDMEKLKYGLEVEKFAWQRSTQQRENTILNRHFGVVITAIISLSAIVVSYLQLGISSNNAKAQIENEKLKNDRQFYREIARFMLTYEQDLKSEDIEKVTYLRDVVLATFPIELATQISTTMRDTARNQQTRNVWDSAPRYLHVKSAKRQ